jgi:hypothetical protein
MRRPYGKASSPAASGSYALCASPPCSRRIALAARVTIDELRDAVRDFAARYNAE